MDIEEKSNRTMILRILATALRDTLPLNEISFVKLDNKQYSIKMFENKISIVEVDHSSPNWTVDL